MLALALLLTPPALAGLDDAALSLETDTLAVGVAPDGSLICRACGLGLIWDPDGASGTQPAGGDWLYTRGPLEAWSLSAQVAGVDTRWNNAGEAERAFTLDWTVAADGPDALALYGEGGDDTLSVALWVVLRPGSDTIGLLLKVDALAPVTGLSVARLVDPDPDYGFNGSVSTLNAGGEGVASASGEWDGRTLALASPGGVGAVCSGCSGPDGLISGDLGDTTGDDQIGVAVAVGDLATGQSATISFAYALGPDAASARAVAVAAAAALSEDLDGDGVSAADGDCDEGSAAVAPGASQQWNGEDEDCDGATDEDSVGSDDDGDGRSEADGDCDDQDASVYPGASPSAGVDDADCDGEPDDGTWAELPETEEKTGACDSSGTAPGRLSLLCVGLAAALLWRRT